MNGTAAAVRSPRWSGWLILGLWVGLTGVLAFGLRAVDWPAIVARLLSVDVTWVIAAIVANLMILPLWALEWQLLVPGTVRVGFRRMFGVVSVTATVLNSIPFLAGEASAVALLMARGGLSRGAALSVLAMDQVMVAFAKLALIAMTALFLPIPGWLRGGVFGLVAVLCVALVLLAPLAHRWKHVRSSLLAYPSRARRAAAAVVSWGEYLEALRQPGRLARVAALSLGKKTLELVAILAVQSAFGLAPSVVGAALVLAALAISTILPLAPANLGIYEATVYAAYRYTGVAPDTALGLAVVQHACFLAPSLVTGYVVLTWQQLTPRASTK